jgi:PAP2 superfamily
MSNSAHSAVSSTRARLLHLSVTVGVCVMALPASARANDPVMEWNDIARQLIVVPALAPVQQTRAMAIVHVAMHDAVNAITGEYERYNPVDLAPAGASPQAAAVAAAYRALLGLFPGEYGSLGTLYTNSLANHGISLDDTGLGFGEAVAGRILALRGNDGAGDAAYLYMPEDAGKIGVWTPISSAANAQALLPGWGKVTPWVLRSGSQFLPEPPPALDSERYAKDYNEIFQIGALTGSTRTDEQTGIARFWLASPTALWNPILRKAVDVHQLDLSARARVMALFYLAAADASVACWDAKYAYNYWRPQPAIARGDEDTNDATAAVPAGQPPWQPLHSTPRHPEYPSGHTTNSSAMAFVLALMFGDAPGFVIEGTSSTNPGFVRHWYTFSEGVEEVIDARVYSGIHFRTADEVGARLGGQVARFVVTHALRRVNGS